MPKILIDIPSYSTTGYKLSKSYVKKYLQIGLRVRSWINTELEGTIVKVNKRGYGSVDIALDDENRGLRVNQALYDWELIIIDEEE